MSSDLSPLTAARHFTCFQPDSTACAGNDSFVKKDASLFKYFDTKCAEFLTEGNSVKFNGTNIGFNNGVYYLSQTDQIYRLLPVNNVQEDQAESVAQCTRGAYIKAVCRPDLTFGLARASQSMIPDTAAANELKSCT